MLLKSLSVVFPMFNEEEYIRGTIAKTLEVLKKVTEDYEIIVVDDASTDASAAITDTLARQDTHIKVIHHKKNRKLGGSLKTGFEQATREFVLYSDMDMPFELGEIKKAAAILTENNADLVAVFRLNRIEEGIKRCIYSVAYNFIIKIMFGLKIRDVNFSFKLIKNDLLKKLHLASEGSFISAEMLIKSKRLGAKIIQFGTPYFPRKNGFSRLSSFYVIMKIIQEAVAFRFDLLRNAK